MIVLALDTTTRAGSVALVADDRIVDERPGDERRTHAERLPAELVAIANEHQIALADVNLFAVAAGPGSFTGLRIGIATMQGLAFTTDRRMVGVSALEALAQLASRDVPPGAHVAAWMDAHRRDVFAALYSVTDAPLFDPARLIPIEPPTVGAPVSVLDRWRAIGLQGSIVFAGDGATLYSDTIGRGLATARIVDMPMLAGAVGRLAVARARRGETVDPAAIQPLYVRRPDAELDRERKGFTTKDTKDTKEKTNRT